LKVTCAICERILDKIKHYIETCLGYPVPICSDCYIRYHQAAPGGGGCERAGGMAPGRHLGILTSFSFSQGRVPARP
jgi:hypothetical protein